ncbi:aspartic peptidase domain-containing protein [Roridomyces roridus]|uniref:Aspartic peptidase domain-containing protein n=1 Tax=Roridomyces roridus TaxID=1738132 RepID=A0AAD7FNH0_9AGAR|nr:aspartic peptidase domain-containing protein [Roridomyces roridus]
MGVHWVLPGLLLLATTARSEFTFNIVLPPAEFSVPFTGKTSVRKHKKDALAALRGVHSRAVQPNLDSTGSDGEYSFNLIVDTGSSDTWVPQIGFMCFDLDRNPIPEADCGFGSRGFDISASKTFKPFPNINLNITYNSGEFLSGPAGFDTISVGGLSVTAQEFSVPNHIAWLGVNVTDGIMGSAFPNLTSVFNTSDPTKASAANRLAYDPFFFSAVKQKKLNNTMFSVALNRPSLDQDELNVIAPDLGILAFGGIAAVPVTNTTVSVPIEGYSARGGVTSTAPGALSLFYTIDVESLTFPGSENLTVSLNNTFIDTGTTFNYLPTDIAAAYNAAFDPPGVIDPDVGAFVVPCNATVPEFSLSIGGKTFTIDTRDQLFPLGPPVGNETLMCYTGTQDGGPAVATQQFILGTVFLHNVVATFDPFAGHLTFTQREKY